MPGFPLSGNRKIKCQTKLYLSGQIVRLKFAYKLSKHQSADTAPSYRCRKSATRCPRCDDSAPWLRRIAFLHSLQSPHMPYERHLCSCILYSLIMSLFKLHSLIGSDNRIFDGKKNAGYCYQTIQITIIYLTLIFSNT